MPKPKLDNYLRTHRKNRGFSQPEIAFLLGCHGHTKISRYECSRQMPKLETIFVYEVILDVPVHELFAGIKERAQRRALQRVRLLLRRLNKKVSDPLLAQKLDFLQAIEKRNSDDLRYEPIPQP
jgi:transcriptional regulator with XRE-family HTH domain